MRERPILFSAPMVLAILEGRKSQTRRLVKESRCKDSGVTQAPCEIAGEVNGGDYRLCPYGVPGDRLWVRESFRLVDFVVSGPSASCAIEFRADGMRRGRLYGKTDEMMTKECGWRPSIHMPRKASRITLEITGVRVERLQGISESNAEAEGVECYYYGGVTLQDHPRYKDYLGSETSFKYSARTSFISLWSTIHAAEGPNGWAANPWVWVIGFRRLDGSN